MPETKRMRIGFVGAGGVGGYFGAKLARGGVDVVLIARGAHAEAMKQDGLQVLENGVEHHCRPAIVDTEVPEDLSKIGDLDWLIFTCKTYQTETLAALLSPYLSDESNLLSLQNGVDGAAQLQELLGRRAHAGLSIRFGAHVAQPGRIEVTGDGYLVIGAFPTGRNKEIDALVETMQGAGVDARLSEDIRRELWRKLIINNGVNPVSAVLLEDTGFVFGHTETAELVDRLMGETIKAAAADGVDLTEKDVEELRSVVFNLDPIKTSMQVDREKGRFMEIDAICGAVIERCRKLGESASVTQTLYALLASNQPGRP